MENSSPASFPLAKPMRDIEPYILLLYYCMCLLRPTEEDLTEVYVDNVTRNYL